MAAAPAHGHHHFILSNPFSNANADSDDDDSSLHSSAPYTPTTNNPSSGLRAQLNHLLPRHAFFHVFIIIHQITNIPLVSGEFAVKWKFKNVHSAPGAKKATGIIGNLKARRKARQDEKSAKGKGRAGGDEADETGSLGSADTASQRTTSIDGRSASVWSAGSSSSSSSSSSSRPSTSRTAVDSTASSPSFLSSTTASTTSTAPSLPDSVLATSTLEASLNATTPARGETPFVKLKEHNVTWEHTLSLLVRMDVDRDPNSTLMTCPANLTIVQRDPANPDARATRLGVVNLDLAQYACKGEVSRRYLLRESKTNATLKLTTHLTHLPSSACAPTSTSPSAGTTSTSTNTFTPPPLPKGEILTGISNILSSPSSLGIIGEHDVYRVRPKGLDLYGPYYDQEELEFDLLGGRAVPSNSSKTKKGKGKGNENEEKPEKDPTTPAAPARRGRERAPTQSFDPSRLPLAYGPKTTETLIEALFNPVRTTHEARESPFTVYVPPEPRAAAAHGKNGASSVASSPGVSYINTSPRSFGATASPPWTASAAPSTPGSSPPPPPSSTHALSPSATFSASSPPTSSSSATPTQRPKSSSSSSTPKPKPKPPPKRAGSAGIGAGLGIMGLGLGMGVGMGVGIGVSNHNNGSRPVGAGAGGEDDEGTGGVDEMGMRRRGTGVDGGVREGEGRGKGKGGTVKGWLKKAGVGRASTGAGTGEGGAAVEPVR
ncbi:hypothetical protein FPV67DRAFT_1695308 [Lyophyllum atratum]|nr:hypothetical protein FPV67DRAFT_1695308 [Lyophyllum atratum]